ncbi:MAG: NAD-dependent epimerase/dehydratase family protein [Acidimicrobiales bacterium]|jgi:nucleoside-diphosphate-sugar epimerase
MKVLVLGGTRFVGLRVCRLLVGAGADVTVLHRGITGPPAAGTRSITGDRSHPDGLAGLGDARFDAVLDLSGYFSDWTKAASEALAGRVAHYVFVSSGAVYRPSPELPWPESTPFGPNPIWGRYGEEKVASEKVLWEAYALGRYAVTCFRFPFILGPGNFADRESFVFSRLEARRPILLPDGGQALNQFVYIDDVARALIAAIERPDMAAGQAYNCTYSRAITNRGWVELCADVLGIAAKIVPIDESALDVALATVDLANLVFPYPSEHYVLDGSKLTRELGANITTGNRRMLEEYANWWESATDHSPRRYAREDKALAALGMTPGQSG